MTAESQVGLEAELREAQRRFQSAKVAYDRTIQERGPTATQLREHEVLEDRARTLLEVQSRYVERFGGTALPTPP